MKDPQDSDFRDKLFREKESYRKELAKWPFEKKIRALKKLQRLHSGIKTLKRDNAGTAGSKST